MVQQHTVLRKELVCRSNVPLALRMYRGVRSQSYGLTSDSLLDCWLNVIYEEKAWGLVDLESILPERSEGRYVVQTMSSMAEPG